MEKHERAVELVKKYLTETKLLKSDTRAFDPGNIKLVWFCKTIQNWKALVADISADGKFFEVTYNGDSHETYVDVYAKVDKIVVEG